MALPLAVAHVGLFALLFVPTPRPARPVEPAAIAVTMMMQPPAPPPPLPPPIDDPDPGGEPAGPPSAAPTPARPTPPKPIVVKPSPRPARTPPPPTVESLPSSTAVSEPNVVLGEAALAGATVAGAGGGGGAGGFGGGSGSGDCDMVRRLQDALRDDPEVRQAVLQTHRALGPGGKAILVWNGEWLRSPGQAGKGLAGVRQAIAMEIAFAPEACKARPMRGLAVIAFADGAGAPRLALGGGDWRWSDLLSARR